MVRVVGYWCLVLAPWSSAYGQVPSTPGSSKAGANSTSSSKPVALSAQGAAGTTAWAGTPALLPRIDEAAVKALGIRRIAGKHLILYTDLPPGEEIDELPRVFDAAVPQWCAYFEIPLASAADWRNVGSLIQDKNRFSLAGLLPGDLPLFPNGYQRGVELWLYEQPSAYYRRHLLLHEGTHAFMRTALGGEGPPWYFEGMAELLATHRWQDGKLLLNYFPPHKADVEQWGRIKIVKDSYKEGAPLRLADIMRYEARAHLRVEAYGWSWAAAAFFDGNPHYRLPFRELRHHVRDRSASFSTKFLAQLPGGAEQLERQWQVYVSRLDYGYDVAREAIELRVTKALPEHGARVSIVADRGWQSTGLRLEAGQKYRLEAAGRYQLATQPKIWWCEPNGVTIRYCDGRPLGLLLAAVVDEEYGGNESNGLLAPVAVGTHLETTFPRSGSLYLRINDYPAELSDNQGQLTVKINRQTNGEECR